MNKLKTVLSKGMGAGTSVVQVQPDTSFACARFFFFFAQRNFFTCSGDAEEHTQHFLAREKGQRKWIFFIARLTLHAQGEATEGQSMEINVWPAA